MPQDTPSRKLDQYIVRFPDGMRDRLKDAAAENGRSLNAEIVKRLERTIAWDAFQAEHHSYFADLQRAAGDEVPLDAQLDADTEAEFSLNAPPSPKSPDDYGAPLQPGPTAGEIAVQLSKLSEQVSALTEELRASKSGDPPAERR
jgi:plasmid stability protein